MAVTPNLGLHQWASSDQFFHGDFNADFNKIDEAVGAAREEGLKCDIGAVAGNGSYPRLIPTPRRPKLVFLNGIYRQSGIDYEAKQCYADGGSMTLMIGTPGSEALVIQDDGFRLTRSGYFNETNRTTTYFCLY